MTQACFDVVTALVDRWAAREGDTLRERVTKRCFIFLYCLMLLALPFTFTAARGRSSTIGMWLSGQIMVCTLIPVLYLRVARRAGTVFVAVATLTIVAAIMMVDVVHAAEANRRMWPIAIVVVDILLVTQAHEMLTIVVVASIIVYLVVVQLEEYLRFGLFDLNGLAPYGERVCQGGCEKPPCPRSAYMTVSILLVNLAIFLLDFYFTRGFALQARREREKIAAAVTAAEQVAERLALLDLDAAEEVLQHSEDVPTCLCASLQVILSHLRGYKPFLPQAVLMPAALVKDVSSSVSSDPRQISTRSSCLSAHSTVPEPFRLQMQRLSLVQLRGSLPATCDPAFLPMHGQVLEAVLQEAASCSGVVDHFGGDVLSLSYNTSASCARHPMMAVQTAAALCLDASHALCKLTGAVVTGKAHVGVLGVPNLRRHCIVGSLETECQNIVKGARILGHRLLCSHTAAVDVDSIQHTRVLLDRFIFDVPLRTEAEKALSSVVHEVLPLMAEESTERVDGEWMYELATLSTDEWYVYNKAGVAFVCGADVEDALKILSDAGVIGEKVSLFQAAVAAACVLDFGTTAVPVHRP